MDATIFVIDDDEFVLKALKGLIESAGFKVDTFSSAADFLARGDPGKADCLVLDVVMPGISGLELHEYLKDSGAKVPIIFISAFDTENIREGVRRSNAIAFLQKPFDDVALLDAIDLALKR